MTTSKQWQLVRDAAMRYEQILVPTILGPAAKALVECAVVHSGETILDVGCGTGAATRFAAEKSGASGRVIGIDVNSGMIDVARSLSPPRDTAIEWVEQSAYELPFTEGEFDIVFCAQTLQFLEDRARALEEMYRVLTPGGRVAASLWCDIHESPYFYLLVQSVNRHIGSETAGGLKAAFSLFDAGIIRALFRDAGFQELQITVEQLDLELPSPHEFVLRHVSATPMSTGFFAASEAARQLVKEDVSKGLTQYTIKEGVRVPFRTIFAMATK